MINKKEKVLLKNTVLLYVLIFSGYLFNFITVPYQTRVLGAEAYGKLGFAMAVMVYFQLVLDFGFIYSATSDISVGRNDSYQKQKIVTSVTVCKLILCILGGSILLLLCNCVGRFKEDILLYSLCYLNVVLNSLLPDYLYRGLEEMQIITIRSVLIKLLFVILVFFFLKSPSDYYVVPILNCVGSFLAIVAVYIHVYFVLKIKFIKVGWDYIFKTMIKAFPYFYSRIASTLYGATNTVVMGFLYPVGPVLGYFTSADKLITTAKSMFSPIADSLYPYMMKNRDFKMIKKILIVFMPLIICGCVIVGIFAEQLCVILFGKEFAKTGEILRLLLPIVVITLPSYILAFPTMDPMGLSKYANLSNVFGATLHIIGMILLFVTKTMNAYTLCIVTCVTETSVLLYRIYIIISKGMKCNSERKCDA